MQQRRAASIDAGYSGLLLLSTDATVVLLRVMVVVTGAVVFGVTLAGLKLHDTSAGSPTHANVTAESNPFTGVIEMVAVALFAEVTINVGVRPEEAPEMVNVGKVLAAAVTE
jgi:hypothetical protein